MGRNLLSAAIACLALLARAAPAAAAGCKLLQLGEIPVTMQGLEPVIDAKINGQAVRLIADSGAFYSTLEASEAIRLNMATAPAESSVGLEGVNGHVNAVLKVAQEFTILGHAFKDVDFVTAPLGVEDGVSGYLGQNFLNLANTEYDLANGAIRLFRLDGCEGQEMAYWDKTDPYSEIPIVNIARGLTDIRASVMVNGVELSALFDTGAAYSVLSLRGAAKAGIKRDDATFKPGGLSRGIAQKLEQTWIVPVQSFKIGDEEIKNTRLRVSEIQLENVDMLIGADFFLSHRIFVANTQHKLYFTYNGGPVFRLEDIANAPPKTVRPAPTGPSHDPAITSAKAPDGEPKDADGYVRRARAFEARGEHAEAIADYTRAIALSSKDPHIFFGRAESHLHAAELDLAQADYDEVLKLKADYIGALLGRGEVHLAKKQLGLARADFDTAEKLNRYAMAEIGGAYANYGDYPEAIAELTAFLVQPRLNEAVRAAGFNNLCWARGLWNQELDKALDDCNEAIAHAPDHPDYRDTRGLIYLRLGRFADAIRDYDSALKAQPKVAWSLYCRGVAKVKMGRQAEGEADMKTALGIDPEVATQAKRYGVTT